MNTDKSIRFFDYWEYGGQSPGRAGGVAWLATGVSTVEFVIQFFAYLVGLERNMPLVLASGNRYRFP